MPLKYVTAEGVATFVHHRGPTTLPNHPPDVSNGRTVLCLHDAGGNGNVFSGVLDALEATHSPVAIDLPGHGRSGGLDSLGAIGAMAAHAKATADALGLPRPVLLGDGMGAAVALEAAISEPAWPVALVLCGGATARFAIAPEVVEAVRRVATGKARREFDQSGYAPTTERPVYEKAFADWLKTDPRALLGDREAQVAWSAEGRLAGVTMPVLVVCGEHEEADSRAAAEALAAALPNAQTAVLAGAGRRGVAEQPAALATAITTFLEQSR